MITLVDRLAQAMYLDSEGGEITYAFWRKAARAALAEVRQAISETNLVFSCEVVPAGCPIQISWNAMPAVLAALEEQKP